jgi:DNA-binding transcriptional ArsR family regulator
MDITAAVADPVRRAILETLNAGPLSAGEIAARFPISRPAVSRHLRLLREAGLVSASQSGRERIYRIETAPLAELDAWLAQFRDRWPSRLDALKTEVYRTRRERQRAERASAATEMSFGGPVDITTPDETKEQPA